MSLDWMGVMREVVQRDEGALQWDFAEKWVQAEMFSRLMSQSQAAGLEVLESEPPYATWFPVVKPKVDGPATKWADLCVTSERRRHWWWIELKVRRASTAGRATEAMKSARRAFAEDIVALLGFDADATIQKWREPARWESSWWTTTRLGPLREHLKFGQQHFVSIFLHTGAAIPWSVESIEAETSTWARVRNVRNRPLPRIRFRPAEILRSHGVQVVEWSLPMNGQDCD